MKNQKIFLGTTAIIIVLVLSAFQFNWLDYGYIFPAITKTLQNAGRCIRSETDRGVIVFLDERYLWNRYFKCFPKDWKMRATVNPSAEIRDFFIA